MASPHSSWNDDSAVFLRIPAPFRSGAMMLDLNDPRKVIARAPRFIMEPEVYYEKFGLFIPNVIFPTGCAVKDGLLWIYYGCCDTAISLATVPLEELIDHIFKTGKR